MELVRRENVRQVSAEDSLQELDFSPCLAQFGKRRGLAKESTMHGFTTKFNFRTIVSSCYINGYKYKRKDLAYLNDLKSL